MCGAVERWPKGVQGTRAKGEPDRRWKDRRGPGGQRGRAMTGRKAEGKSGGVRGAKGGSAAKARATGEGRGGGARARLGRTEG
jgi:hypothetical protein